MAAALLLCAGTLVFVIATLCSCGAIKDNSHIILMVSAMQWFHLFGIQIVQAVFVPTITIDFCSVFISFGVNFLV